MKGWSVWVGAPQEGWPAKPGHGAKGPAGFPEALQTLDRAESIRYL